MNMKFFLNPLNLSNFNITRWGNGREADFKAQLPQILCPAWKLNSNNKRTIGISMLAMNIIIGSDFHFRKTLDSWQEFYLYCCFFLLSFCWRVFDKHTPKSFGIDGIPQSQPWSVHLSLKVWEPGRSTFEEQVDPRVKKLRPWSHLGGPSRSHKPGKRES